MRKFKLDNVVKYTDNDVKARELLRLGYEEIEGGGDAPKFNAQGPEPKSEDVETAEVEKGVHTTEEATTDKVEDGKKKEPAKTTKSTAKKSTAKKED